MGRTITQNGINAEVYTAVNTAVGGLSSKSETLTNKTLSAPIISNASLEDNYREEVYVLTGTILDPLNGSIQYTTLTGATTLTVSASFVAGHSILLMINPGTFAVTWPTITWAGGSAPTLDTSKFNTIVLWRVGSVMYGAAIGAMG